MFNEIYTGFTDILTKDPSESLKEEMRDLGKIPHFLAITFDFDIEKIIRIKRIKIKNCPDIILVLGFPPEENPNAKYCDYVVIDGELCKLILLNMYALTSGDKVTEMYTISWALHAACLTTIEQNMTIVNLSDQMRYSFGTLAYYAAPAILIQLTTKLLYSDQHDFYPLVAAAIRTVCGETPSRTAVDSIHRAIEDAGLKMLLDNSLYLSLDKDIYPEALFADEIDESAAEDFDDEDIADEE